MVLTKLDVDDVVKLLLINNQKILHGYVIATLYFKIGEYHQALKYVSKYLHIQPNSFVAYKLQGECYEKLNRPDDALKSYRKALKSVDKNRNLKRSAAESINVEKCKEEVLREKVEILKSYSVIEKHGNESNAVKVDEMDITLGDAIHPSTPSTPALEANINGDALSSETTFDFRVMHITSLDCVVQSEIFSFQNLLWSVVVAPKRDLGAYRAFSVYLTCIGRRESSRWSCNVNAEFRLLSNRPDRDPFVQKTRHLFNREADMWGFPTFMSWYEVVGPDGNYMEDDCITVQVHLEILN